MRKAFLVLMTVVAVLAAAPGWAQEPPTLESLSNAAQAARKGGSDEALLRALIVLANAEREAGLVSDSLEHAKEAVQLSTRVGGPRLRAQSLVASALAIASLAESPEDTMASANQLREAAGLAAKAGDGELEFLCLVDAVRVLGAADRWAEAGRTAREAVEKARRVGPAPLRSLGLLSIGDAGLRALGIREQSGFDAQLVRAAADEAVRPGGTEPDERVRAHRAGIRAELARVSGDTADAMLWNRAATAAAHRAGAPEQLYRWYWQRGRLLAAQGQRQDAIEAYRWAQRHLAEVRADLDQKLNALKRAFREIYGPLYQELADLLLRESAATADAGLRQALLRETRAVVEATKVAELQDYFQDGCVAAQQQRVAGLEEVAARTVVVYPVLLADRLELIVSEGQNLAQFSAPIGAAAVEDLARRLRNSLETPASTQYRVLGRALYLALFKPLEPLLERVRADTIVFVPDGPLRTVPIAALHDGERFLVEKYAIAITPGLSLTDPRPLAGRRFRVLANGVTEAVQGFPALPAVAAELAQIGALMPALVLRDKEFLLAQMQSQIGEHPYTVVHIASHGQFDSDPKRTFVLSYDDKLDMDRLEKLISPTRFRDQPVELLTLSACQTAAGDDRAALGLAGAAVKAGARSVVASLWFIGDEASSKLMASFYRELRNPGATKAGALRAAQRALLADPQWSHPAFWAPFLVIGNWL